MENQLDETTVKSTLSVKSTDELVWILLKEQSKHQPNVITLIKNILIERGYSQSQLDEHQESYKEFIKEQVEAQDEDVSASFFIRVFQNLLDYFFIFIFWKITVFTISQLFFEGRLYTTGLMPGFVIFLCYYSFLIGINNKTIGMNLTRLKVVTNDNTRLDFGHGVSRAFSYAIVGFTFGIGHLWMLFDKKKRTWVDILSKTKVVSA